jgi:hypothetical protein
MNSTFEAETMSKQTTDAGNIHPTISDDSDASLPPAGAGLPGGLPFELWTQVARCVRASGDESRTGRKGDEEVALTSKVSGSPSPHQHALSSRRKRDMGTRKVDLPGNEYYRSERSEQRSQVARHDHQPVALDIKEPNGRGRNS